MLHAVIMAGGSGTRFWPQSTQEKPKQFLSLFGDETMLQTTVERIQALIPSERVWIITNRRYVDLVQEQLPDIPASNVIGEPVAKNTAPCVAAASALIQQQDSEAMMAVLPADHLIADTGTFLSVLKAAAEKARSAEALLTIGIKPTRPETGYGYIEFDEASGEAIDGYEIRKVMQFREKPDVATARQFISASRFLWNSGMFIWSASTILEQFKRYLPDIYEAVNELQAAAGGDQQAEALSQFYHTCPSVSIDYGIMEKAENVFVIPADFGWNDVGSWKALYELSGKDEQQNVLQDVQMVSEKSSGNYVHGTGDKVISLVGVKDLAVIETEQAILVCNLDEAQGVKQIVKQLKDNDEMKKFL